MKLRQLLWNSFIGASLRRLLRDIDSDFVNGPGRLTGRDSLLLCGRCLASLGQHAIGSGGDLRRIFALNSA